MKLTNKCDTCHGESLVLKRRIIANGTFQVGQYCLSCNDWAQRGLYIPHEQVRAMGLAIDKLEIVEDLRDKSVTCSVAGCHEYSVEWHHWAPRKIFGRDCEYWPQGYLCMKHHRQWHRMMEGKDE